MWSCLSTEVRARARASQRWWRRGGEIRVRVAAAVFGTRLTRPPAPYALRARPHSWEVDPVLPERDEDEDELHWARRQNFTKDKDSNVVAPLGEIMGALCTYLDRRFGLTAAQATAILAKAPSPGPT